jgi:NAD(P)-dependent dehydrogenase (short-subunit alcohol dehydrogenase family)
MKMKHVFEGKVAVVTGGASGIGRALCEELAHQGTATVVIADIDTPRAAQVAGEICANGGHAQARHVDVSRRESVHALVAGVVRDLGRLDYMFNNAGVTICGEVRDMEPIHWQRILEVDLWGVIYGTTAAYRVMLEQGHGHIVNIASLDGLAPMPMSTPYTAAKHGVVGLSTALRLEAEELGIKVSVACPGAVRTEVFDRAAYVGIEAEAVKQEMYAEFSMMEPAQCARNILRGVARNKNIILDGAPHNRVFWWVQRLSPDLYGKLMRVGVDLIRKHRVAEG